MRVRTRRPLHHFIVDALFWATLAIAAGTFVLALGTVYLAWSTKKGISLQEREFAAAQAAARPQLEIDIAVYDRSGPPHPVNGHVRYVHGAEPAYDVEIWVKTRTKTFGRRLGTILTPSVPDFKSRAPDHSCIQNRRFSSLSGVSCTQPYHNFLRSNQTVTGVIGVVAGQCQIARLDSFTR